ncbi:MAG: GHMP kinase [Verrucomicrobiota bacterium]
MEKNRVINAVAPTRICDVGGWTDTHFARFGSVFNIAIYPYVEVQVHLLEQAESDERVIISAENFGESYTMDPNRETYDKHPLIEAAIQITGVPEDLSIRVNIFSFAPPGASMGTSAAVTVALVGALDALTPGRLTAHEAARLAHSVETDKLGLQCGIQDQLASAYGGVNFIDMQQFPHAGVSPIQVPNNIWWELEQRILLIYIGNPHNSSAIHDMVIRDLGDNPHEDARLEELRNLAGEAKDVLFAGDFVQLGQVLNRNTEVQRALHPNLVCDKFEEIISVAGDFDAVGCKVNGAGGDGGSIAILTDGDMFKKRQLRKTLVDWGFQTLPVYLSRQGLRVW